MDDSPRRRPIGFSRRKAFRAFTLVELLIVIGIIGILVSLLIPAANLARESSRRAACSSNLRQFGIGFYAHAERHNGLLCTGAFDWKHDGPVTEVGWVADLVNMGTLAGEMLCPSSEARISEAYEDLLKLRAFETSSCVDWLGKPAKLAPDGTKIVNPCRVIAEAGLEMGEKRRQIVEEEIFAKHYNTNYTASWILVRSQPRLDSSGNLNAEPAGCSDSVLSRNATYGPLSQSLMEASKASSSVIPLLGCGSSVGSLPQNVGANVAGSFVARSFTRGPRLKATLQTPVFSKGTSREGPSGWWAVWEKQAVQDYRGFGPVHRGICNILMGDGSVKSITDANEDGVLNNGFASSAGGGFASSEVEMLPDQFFSKASLRGL